jgi:hypothetical protein
MSIGNAGNLKRIAYILALLIILVVSFVWRQRVLDAFGFWLRFCLPVMSLTVKRLLATPPYLSGL